MKGVERQIGREARRSPWLAHRPTTPIHHELATRGLILAIGLLAAIDANGADSAQPAPWERALACVQDSMARSRAPWPQAWRQEYAQTIREVVTSHRETSQYDKRLTILCHGFPAYWEGLRKAQDRSLFEVHCAEIRWYIDCLMDANLPREEESRALRR